MDEKINSKTIRRKREKFWWQKKCLKDNSCRDRTWKAFNCKNRRRGFWRMRHEIVSSMHEKFIPPSSDNDCKLHVVPEDIWIIPLHFAASKVPKKVLSTTLSSLFGKQKLFNGCWFFDKHNYDFFPKLRLRTFQGWIRIYIHTSVTSNVNIISGLKIEMKTFCSAADIKSNICLMICLEVCLIFLERLRSM